LLVGGKLDVKGTVGKLHEGFIVRKYLILIMELVEGKTILEYLSRKPSITEEDVAVLIRALVETLAALHSRNVVHLDIRPTNIRMKDGKPVLLDYNSARHLTNKKAGDVVDVIGDTTLCAPEMLSFHRVRSDMWAIGVLTFIMLSGVNPYFYEDESLVSQNIERVNYKMGAEFDTVSTNAKDFVKAMFKRGPEMRMTAAQALEHAFLKEDNCAIRKKSVLKVQDAISRVDMNLLSREEEEYIEASLVFRTFDEEAHESEESSDEE